MNRGAALRALAVALSTSLAVTSIASVATAQRLGSLEAPRHLDDARREGHYTFCSKPKEPLSARDRELCPLAAQADGCDGFAAACRGDVTKDGKRHDAPEDETPKAREPSSSSHSLPGAVGALAQLLVWLLMAAVIVAVAIPLVRALLRARRDKAVADVPHARNVASIAGPPPPPPPEAISDAEAALRDADEHARRGDLTRALSLYLSASLVALDRRGAIRLARHRTNGEYVRSCAEDESKRALREIVREVDRVEFGKLAPTAEGVAHVASRASSVVRSRGAVPRGATSFATMMMSVLVALSLLGCGGPNGRTKGAGIDSPSGDQLPMDLLRRSGFDAVYTKTALAALPVPGPQELAPIVVVDMTRVPLEEESAAHLLRWVEAGGVLVLFGAPSAWPAELGAQQEFATDDHVDVVTADVYARGARVGGKMALAWPESEPVAFISAKRVYAARFTRGKGAVIGVAGHELATNIGVSRADNAGAFVALLDVAAGDLRRLAAERGHASDAQVAVHFARTEDGIPPPSNPFSALIQAGLGRGSWHALAAALVLFLAFGIRQARPRPAAPAPRRAFAEHVEATGAFYGRARAVGHALASYGRFAEMRLRERIPRGTDPVQFLAARAKVTPDEAARVWKRATEAKEDDPPRGDELTTIRDLGAMLSAALETRK